MSIVETTHGKVEGREHRGVHVFKGIPYAAPPVRERRLRPPAAPEPWSGTLDAGEFSPVAPQNASFMYQALGASPPPSDEAHCLTVNVWTPKPDDARRAVMVWFHGGAFIIGDGRTPWYDGTNLARRDVVVVTLNSRLGALGYLHLADVVEDDGGDPEAFRASGNCGLLDQAAALEWVAANIAGFGGDPENVTVFGESAGAMGIGALFALPSARARVKRAVLQSGAAAHIHDRERASRMAREFLDELEIRPRHAATLRDLPVERVLAAQDAVLWRHWGAEGITMPFQPVIDGATIEIHPLDAVARGDTAGIDLLVGTTRDELRLFLAFDPTIREETDDEIVRRAGGILGDPAQAAGLVDAYREHLGDVDRLELWGAVLTDRVFTVPAIELAERQVAHRPTTFSYRFDYASPAFGGILGAAHALDLPFTFDNLDATGAAMFAGEPTADTRALATAMADAWTTFARHGRPTAPGLPEWPPYDLVSRPTMVLDTQPRVVVDLHGPVRRIWGVR